MDTNKCTTIDETSTTDGSKSQSGMRRCRDHTDEVTSFGSSKRRKLDFHDQSPTKFDVNSPACDRVLSSPCFDDGVRTETSSSSEICLDSSKLESNSSQAVTSHSKPSTAAAKTPTSKEIDEFFSVVEKEEQKRLSDKYNFDFVNEVALEGRYQWVRLKP